MLHLRIDTGRAGMPRATATVLMVFAAVTAGVTACTAAPPHDAQPQVPLAAQTRIPASATSVLAGPASVVAADTAGSLFASAPVVVIADPSRPAELAIAARSALREHAPLLLTSARADGSGPSGAAVTTALITAAAAGHARSAAVAAGVRLLTRVKDLNPRAVLAVGVAGNVLAAQLPGIHVVTSPAMLPATKTPAPLSHVALLVPAGDHGAATVAAAATAKVAGVPVVAVRGDDPRADPAAITALSAAQPRQVLAIGAGFGPVSQLASRIAVAQTGVELPGGGQVMFPMRRLVALYGNPGTPALGVLGQQDLQASIMRARDVAAAYRSLSKVPVIPTFEIIATVASAFPGPDGQYSYQTPLATLRPWVQAATAAGMYVILDLQPGRANLLTQAREYQSLLKLPDVGLALDAEWKLQPGQLPLQQIGSVDASEINEVISWLSYLTAKHHLPQKLLVLHQFRLSMIRDEQAVDTGNDEVTVLIHMDGQGTPGDKEQTWAAVIRAAPAGVHFGWKDFYVKDHPMLTPWQTFDRTPRLSMISYQLSPGSTSPPARSG